MIQLSVVAASVLLAMLVLSVSTHAAMTCEEKLLAIHHKDWETADLSLSGCGLKRLPKEVFTFTQLTKLDLTGNDFAAADIAGLKYLTNLRVLSLWNNELKTVPEDIRELPLLEELHLAHNQLVSLPDWLGSVSSLRKLIVYDNKLSSLPSSLAGLTKLQVLNLFNNTFETLPDFVCGMTSIVELVVSHNLLHTLPSCIGRLNRLETLSANSNLLTELPASMADLTELTGVYLAKNSLESVPDHLFARWTYIMSIDLGYNRFKTVPEAILRMSHLEQVHMFGNQLTDIPDALARLTNLHTLDLGGNDIETISAGRLSNLPKLRRLDLVQNELKGFPMAVLEAKSLTELLLARNKRVKTVPESIVALKGLRLLDVSDTSLESLPPVLATLPLTSLDLGTNPSFTTATGALPDFIGTMKGLKILRAFSLRLRVTPTWVQGLTALEELDLSRNGLTTLPALPNSIRIARFSYNSQVKVVPEEYGLLPRLEDLDLFELDISAVPKSLCRKDHLAWHRVGWYCEHHNNKAKTEL